MTDEELTRAYEHNISVWWEAQVCATDGVPDRTRGLWWTLDREGGASGIHKVRSTADDLHQTIEQCLDEAAPFGSAVWAYVSEVATPEDAVQRFKSAGFQHAKRFDVLALELEELPKLALPKGYRLEELTDMGRFSKTVAHPYFGKVTTETRKRAVAAAGQLLQTRSEDFKSYLLSEGELPVSIVTVLSTDGMAGVYDVGTIESHRGRGLARCLLTHALREARKSGAKCAGLIAVGKAEPLYERVGFRPTGWLSLMYYSKTKARQRALAA